LVAAYWIVVITGLLTIQYLFGFYRDAQTGIAAVARNWITKWDASPEILGGFSYSKVALVSFLGMFLEMLMIRWISSEVSIFAYFKNFVLVACFFGFGMGCYFGWRRINLIAFLCPILFLCAFVKAPWPGLRQLVAILPNMLGRSSEVQIWGVPYLPTEWLSMTLALSLTVPLFMLVVFAFVPVGQMVGWYLEHAPQGIRAYSINVGASLFGIVGYTIVCFLNLPPAAWFSILGLLVAALFWRVPRLRWTSFVLVGACIVLVSVGPGHGSRTYWSPYQKVTVTPLQENGETTAYELSTNNSWHQEIVNLSPQFVVSHPGLFIDYPIKWNPYNLPYRFYEQPRSVLVLGAGTGNDVAAALRNGAGTVVAVEIDPLILELGRKLHFEKPYDSPKVHTIVNDARSYVQNSRDKFDLIVFSLLDSHTTSSNFSNIRIDNYVYTVEALQAAHKLLRPGGLLVLKFWTETPWIAGRLQALLSTVFGHPPLQIQSDAGYATAGRFFLAGSPERIAEQLKNTELNVYVRSHQNFAVVPASPTTDNWPYFYQHEPGLPLNIILISFLVVGASWWFVHRTGNGRLALDAHFFCLGAGFLLLEVQIVSKVALLFGTTWLVNSIVVGTVLLLIMAANTTVRRYPLFPLWIAYTGIVVSGLLAFSVPLERFFFTSVMLKALAALAVLCSPAYFAGIVFARSYATVRFSSEALGSNIIGALLGGILESLSFWTGLRALFLISIGFYIVAAILPQTNEEMSAKVPALAGESNVV
jgi:SAM-dependent methyltransferase